MNIMVNMVNLINGLEAFRLLCPNANVNFPDGLAIYFRGQEQSLRRGVLDAPGCCLVNYTSEQFRLQAAMCLERAAAQSDALLKAGWLESAQHLLAASGESATTLPLRRAATQGAETTEREADSSRVRDSLSETSVSTRA